MQRTRIGAQGKSERQTPSVGERAKDIRHDARAEADEKFRSARTNAREGRKAEVPVRPTESVRLTESVRPTESARPAEPREETRPALRPEIPVREEKTVQKANDFAQTLKQTVNSPENVIPAQKTELDTLDEAERKVYNKMKPNVPTLPDELVDEGCDIGTVMGALTVLEVAGAVESGSGGYFMRVAPDDIMQSEND